MTKFGELTPPNKHSNVEWKIYIVNNRKLYSVRYFNVCVLRVLDESTRTKPFVFAKIFRNLANMYGAHE